MNKQTYKIISSDNLEFYLDDRIISKSIVLQKLFKNVPSETFEIKNNIDAYILDSIKTINLDFRAKILSLVLTCMLSDEDKEEFINSLDQSLLFDFGICVNFLEFEDLQSVINDKLLKIIRSNSVKEIRNIFNLFD